MPSDGAWFAEPTGFKAVQSSEYVGDPNTASWLPNQSIAKRWMEYVLDTQVGDTTPPPAPASVAISEHTLRWEAEADVESGISHFVIERDGVPIGTWQEKPANRFGRPLFQELQYSDTPPQPLIPMVYTIPSSERREGSQYQVRAVNTVGLQSQPTRAARP
jgi:hypothetical protein